MLAVKVVRIEASKYVEVHAHFLWDIEHYRHRPGIVTLSKLEISLSRGSLLVLVVNNARFP